jgi:hypothetical protein
MPQAHVQRDISIEHYTPDSSLRPARARSAQAMTVATAADFASCARERGRAAFEALYRRATQRAACCDLKRAGRFWHWVALPV